MAHTNNPSNNQSKTLNSSKTNNQIFLGYLGLYRFVLVGANFLFEMAIFSQAFLFYSISIMSFVAGILWRTTNSIIKLVGGITINPSIGAIRYQTGDTLPGHRLCVYFILQKRSTSESLSFDYQRMRERVLSVVLVCHLFFAAQLHLYLTHKP